MEKFNIEKVCYVTAKDREDRVNIVDTGTGHCTSHQANGKLISQRQ